LIVLITVTYGNRSNYFKKVIESSLDEGVDQIVIVDNGSIAESRIELYELCKKDERVHLLRNDENTGSSGGFYTGIEYVMNNFNSVFVWLLDDDNVPQKNALKILTYNWSKLKKIVGKDVVLYSNRIAQEEDSFKLSQPELHKIKSNTFLGFGFQEYFKFFGAKNNLEDSIFKVDFGPYGGLFTSLDVLRSIGLPNRDFFLYADDHEFTLRLYKMDIPQYIVLRSVLRDIDSSFPLKNGLISPKTQDFKIYYTVRNHIFLKKQFIKVKSLYFINKYIFVSWLFIKLVLMYSAINPIHVIRRISLITKAIYDGENSLLGKHDKYA
jgi:GT2 family glycosyltransferase